MSRRGFDLLVGGVLVLVLALQATAVVACGLAYAWWLMRRSPGELQLEAVERAVTIGGFAGRMLIALLMFFLVPLLTSSGSVAFTRDFLLGDANRTGLGLFSVGVMALLQAFFLGLSVRLLGPGLPR